MDKEKFASFGQWATEILLILSLPFVTMLRFFIPFTAVKNNNSDKPPIIIIEQWFTKTISHMFLKQYLEEKQFKVYVFNFNLFTGGVDDGAYQLMKFINNRNISQCVLVGISVGAVTSYIYAQRFGGWKKVKKVLCMAGPFRGTPWAHSFSFLKGGRQLLPHSSFLRQIEREKILYPNRVVCITAKQDEFVPRWSSILGKVRKKKISIVGHNNLHIWSKEVWNLIVREAGQN